jgi:hypothetical protein
MHLLLDGTFYYQQIETLLQIRLCVSCLFFGFLQGFSVLDQSQDVLVQHFIVYFSSQSIRSIKKDFIVPQVLGHSIACSSVEPLATLLLLKPCNSVVPKAQTSQAARPTVLVMYVIGCMQVHFFFPFPTARHSPFMDEGMFRMGASRGIGKVSISQSGSRARHSRLLRFSVSRALLVCNLLAT